MSKQIVLDAMRNMETPRTPWVPFVGCHAASLIGVSAEEFFKDGDLIEKGVVAAYEAYRPDGLPVLFDLQFEAEALGCKLKYASDNPPAVTTHPLEDGVPLSELKIPGPDDGRIGLVMDASKRICEKLGDKIALYGLITGPFTLALHLLGADIFYEMMDNPERVHDIMMFCQKVCIRTAGLYIDSGVDIIAVVDPMTSQISPASFAEFVSPYAAAVFESVRQRGKLSSFFVCGDATRNIEEMCKSGPDNISIDENIPLEYVKKTAEKYGVSVGGNIKLTLTMLFGTPMDNINDAENCMAIGGKQGFILSPGCDMPFATPRDNVKAISSLIHGEVLDFLSEVSTLDDVVYELPDYKNEAQVWVDVITLDSESCAPCQYMMEAVRSACDGFGDAVLVLEHKIKLKESVVCMMKLGVSNIPTIVIDGEVKYISLVPDVSTLREDVAKAVAVKAKKAQ